MTFHFQWLKILTTEDFLKRDRIKYCSLSYNQKSTGDLDTSILPEEEDTAMKSLMEGKSLGTEIPEKLFGIVERKLSS